MPLPPSFKGVDGVSKKLDVEFGSRLRDSDDGMSCDRALILRGTACARPGALLVGMQHPSFGGCYSHISSLVVRKLRGIAEGEYLLQVSDYL